MVFWVHTSSLYVIIAMKSRQELKVSHPWSRAKKDKCTFVALLALCPTLSTLIQPYPGDGTAHH